MKNKSLEKMAKTKFFYRHPDLEKGFKDEEFKTKKELFDFLAENKTVLMTEKKFIPKKADSFSLSNFVYHEKENAFKSNDTIDTANLNEIKTLVAINTTNLFDSHKDVHLPGLWKKSLSENKFIMHLQEHSMAFEKIIAKGKDLKAYTKNFTWKELGYDYKGTTEALLFESIIRRKRNPVMFDQYANGYVDNHSVGMKYVSLTLCVDDDGEDFGAEYEAWEKYFPLIANADEAKESGYFWAVKEAKVIEGSAVPLGSNPATPTLENNMKSMPGDHMREGPSNDTLRIDYNYLSKNLFN